jgi:GTP-binding protein Era
VKASVTDLREDAEAPVETRAGFAAILGTPNSGKSTLVNAIVGEKVSIVTHKVQTTRFPIRGVAMRDSTQIVLVDTPGVFAPRRRLDRAMVAAAWRGAEEADVIVHVVDALAESRAREGRASAADQASAEDDDRVLAGLQKTRKPVFLALNKVDILAKEYLLPLAQKFEKTGAYTEIFMISALKGEGVEALVKAIADRMPVGPWLYPADQAADMPLRLLAAEVTREKVYLRLHQELPYKSTVETEDWKELKDGSARIEQTLYVERESQRKIALGRDGSAIKAISMAAREELQELLGRPVHLFLYVKVREGWADDRARYTAVGLDYEA